MTVTSFIDDIKKITDNQQEFVVNNVDINTQSLANYLPNGKLYQAKNIQDSNMRNVLGVLALELIRKETTIKTLADQYYPFTTIDFIVEWEQALRIPDDCFKIEGISLEQRQKQIIAKLAIDNIITLTDFVALAAFFGFTITIQTGFDVDTFPATFPFILSGTIQEQKFTIIVTFHNLQPELGFPYTFPFNFPTNDPNQFLECLIKKLVPANVSVIFRIST